MDEALQPMDAETVGLLGGLCKLIDGLVERDKNWRFPEPGSPLFADDQRMPKFEPSSLARLGLIGAVDHLFSIAALLRGDVLPARAIFTLARGALENASVAVWLLSPNTRAERLKRAILWHAMNIKFREKALDLATDDPQHAAARQAEVQKQRATLLDFADKAGLGPADKNGISNPRVSYEGIVKAASHAVPMNIGSAELVWNMCSGMSHGQEWAVHNMSDSLELPGSDEHFVHLSLTVKDDSLLAAVWVAVQMCQHAFDLFDTRGRALLKPKSA